jgi:hypothetical protein
MILLSGLTVLLITVAALGQNKSPVATNATNPTTHELVENESTVETYSTTDEAGSVSSTSKKTLARVHFELHPELAATGKSKHSSFELFPASKPARVPRLNATAKATDEQPQKAAGGADDAAELSKKLANPLASLISFPIQTNFDIGMGDGSGWKMTINLQPVIPIALNKKWNLISRTIIPIIHQGSVVAPGTGQSGLGDVVQSIFISPNKSEPFIWGVGPVVLIPTATNEFLGGKQLGLGPTVVVLKQQKGWTVGTLWNHIWRVAGGSGRPRVNSDFIQPFVSYSTKDGWSYTLNTESTYDWTSNSWAIPIHFQIAKIVRFGKQPVSFGGAIRCWVTSPEGGPESCGPRIVITGIFPKK